MSADARRGFRITDKNITFRIIGKAMIKLTRLDGEPFVLNAELIRYVEARPDTFVTLTTGDRVVVAESMDEVVEKAIDYQRNKHWIPASVSREEG